MVRHQHDLGSQIVRIARQECDSSIFCSALHSQFRTEIGSQTMISQNTNQWPTAIYVPRAGRYGKSVPIAESCLLHLADISMLSVWGKGIPQFGKGIRLLSAFPGEYPLGQDRSIGRWQVGATTAAELSLVRKHTETFYHEPEVLNHSTSVRQYRILFGIKQDFLSKFELPELSEFIASLFDKTGGCIRSFDRRTLIVREFIWPPPTPPPPNAKNTCEAFAPTMKLAPDEKTLLSGKMDTSKFTKLQKIKYWLAIAMGGISILLSSLVIAAQLLKQYI